ncbi:MAG: putative manganese transporter [Bacteroidota bacterium]|nr:putative manganese transporter [Bacteroidota bacterium]
MLIDILRQTIMITSLVLVMMLLIEYFNIVSNGQWGQKLAQSKFKQLIVAALLGLVPGCIGGFAAVSMFTHNLLNFGALTAAMIASTGDESFVMISMFPKTAILLNIIVFVIAILSGIIINLFVKKCKVPYPGKTHMVIHSHETVQQQHSWRNILKNLKNISFQRSILILGLLLFLFGIVTGQFEHSGHELAHKTAESHSDWGIENLLFMGLSLGALYILLLVDEHFLEDHLWGHIIKKHFVRIFLWTFGALLGIELLINYMDITPWLQHNYLTVLILALVVGIIPESGPHLIFVTLFYNGSIPFSILLANSIVQDGHSSLPLLAESKRNFFLMKGINLLIGLICGLTGYFMGW